MTPRHFIRLGTHAEKEYFSKLTGFDSVVLNANLIESTSAAMAFFALTMKKANHDYVIDPYTHAYAVEPSQIHSDAKPTDAKRPRIKATFKALAERYGIPLGAELGVRSLQPADLPEAVLRTIVERCLSYQNDRLGAELAANIQFLGDDGLAEGLVPAKLLAPYFVDEFDGTWTGLNRRALLLAAELAGHRVAGVIAFDSRSASDEALANLAREYSLPPVNDYFIWATDLDEHHTSPTTLQQYARFVRTLAQAGKSVTAFYGGFFALLLSYLGLRGVSHGVAYGDKRGMEPVAGGGLPPPMYYVRAVRDVIRIGDLPILATGLDAAQYRSRICACLICDELLRRGGPDYLFAALAETEYRPTSRGELREVPARSVYKLVKYHFLFNRQQEFIEVTESSFAELSQRMRDEAAWVASRLGQRSVAHIGRWITAVT
jgi:hypothetical protein